MYEAARSEGVMQECLRASRIVYRYMGARLDAVGVTPAQLDVLDVLRQQEGIPLNRLGEALCCVRSNVTALVDRMARDGLVERRGDPNDRRVTRLFLGPAGRQKLDLLGDAARCCPETLEILTSEERSTLVRLLRKLTDGLGGACSVSAPECCNEGGEKQ